MDVSAFDLDQQVRLTTFEFLVRQTQPTRDDTPTALPSPLVSLSTVPAAPLIGRRVWAEEVASVREALLFPVCDPGGTCTDKERA